MGMVIEVTSGVIATLVREATAAAPEECCGLLLGSSGQINSAIPAANVHPDRQCHFEIDPIALIEAHRSARSGGPELLGYYHSHPAGHPVPSATDCEHASADGRCWAIIAGGEVRFYRDGKAGFEALPTRVVDG
jgi:proteasome lid subunit RPN8/RPN11